MHRLFTVRPFFVVIIWIFLGTLGGAQGIDDGKLWLVDQINNGILAKQHADINAVALSCQSAKESIEALRVLGESASSNSKQLLAPFDATKENNTTLFLATQMSSYALLGDPFPSTLLLLQNSDGGFGHSEGYGSSSIDTAEALEALFAADSNSAATNKAIRYLVQTQSTEGTWQDTAGEKLYPTALALHALWLHRKSHDVLDAMQQAKTYLLSLKRSDGSFSDEIFETALVLRSIAPFMHDASALQDTINYLDNTQEGSGSWANDVYTTALVLQALSLAEREVPDPDLVKLSGKVVDADTGVALSGIVVSLSNEANTVTHADGLFNFSRLKNGTYTLFMHSNNYAPLHATVRIEGKDVDFGVLRLSRGMKATVSVLKGTIKERKTSLPLSGVTITLDDREVYTDGDGNYMFDTVEAGSHTLAVNKAGYIRKQQTITVPPNTIMHYNGFLDSTDFTTEAKVQGRVIDDNASMPLADATVALSGTKDSTLQTDTKGRFHFSKLGIGDYKIVISKIGYRTVRSVFTVTHTGVIDYGDVALAALSPSDTRVTVRGVVSDALENTPIKGVTIKAGTKQATTDSNGSYEIRGIQAGVLHLEASKEGYSSQRADANASEGMVLIFSPALRRHDANLSIFGTVLDRKSSEPLSNVKVEYRGDTDITVLTDSKGYYVFSPVKRGNATLQYSKAGYKEIGIAVSVGDVSLSVSPVLDSIDAALADNNASISAVVKDITTGLVLDNTAVRLIGKSDDINTTTDENGTFVIEDIKSYDVNLTLSKDTYKRRMVPIHLPENIKYTGIEIQLLPNNIANFETDISIENLVNKTYCNPFTFDTNGSLVLKVKNNSLYPITNAFRIFVFYDKNNNRQYDENETLIADKIINDTLEHNETKSIPITIETTLPFRDAPITIHVDSDNSVLESDEENNIITTSDAIVSKERE